jgi:hypothetical protein
MLESIDWKLLAAAGGVVVGLGFSIPYIIDILRKKTQPHAYTWLIWSLTQGIGAAGILHGGGGITGYGWWMSTGIAFLVFLLSFRYGTKNITRSDTFVLAAAIIAILAWVGLHEPLLAVILATLIDFLGYIPTFRKSWTEPWREDLLAWVGFIIAPTLSFLSLTEYNFLTSTYVVMTILANLGLSLLLIVRRQAIPKPS